MSVIWYTIHEYVDNHTGEVIDKNLVEKHYVIIKKTKNTSYEHRWINNKRETFGRITYTNECTRDSKQLTIW